MDTHRIEIRANKKKSIKIIFYGFLLIGMGIFLLVIADSQQILPPFAVKLIAYVSLAVFTPMLIYIFYRLFDDSPRIILDSTGIIDNSTLTSPGFIPWREIAGFEMKEVFETQFIGIVLKNHDAVNRSLHPAAQFFNSLNKRLYKSSHMISTQDLNIEFDELTELIYQYHQKYSG